MGELEDLTGRIKSEVGCPEYRARAMAKQALGMIPPKTKTNGATSNYFYEPEQFKLSPEQRLQRDQFLETVRRRNGSAP